MLWLLILVPVSLAIDRFPVRTKHHREDRGLYEWLTPLHD